LETENHNISIEDIPIIKGISNFISVKAVNSFGESSYSNELKIYVSECEQDILLIDNDNLNDADFEIYNAVNSITAKNVFINNEKKVVFKAGNNISLQKGFHADKSGYFHAYLEGCNNTKSAKLKSARADNVGYSLQETEEVVELQKEKQSTDINIYPNPNQGTFNIDLQNNQLPAIVKVYSSSGNLVYNKTHQTSNFDIDISGYSKGIYIVKVITGGQCYYQKIIYQ